MSIVSHPGGILQAAIDYAARGYRVIPTHGLISDYCSCGHHKDTGRCKAGKHPATRHGCHDATSDPDTIRAWWRDLPWANVAIVQGHGSFVLESDPRHGGDDTIAEHLAQHGAMPTTPAARSGGGGTHWYFRYPVGTTIKSRSNVAPGVDVRGDAGYVLAPPSLHASGNRYDWVTPIDTPLADAPQWVLDLVSDRPSPASRSAGAKASNATPAGGFVFVNESPHDFAQHPGAGSGQRHGTLMHLVGVHVSRGDSPQTIEAMASAWGQRCTPPMAEADIVKCLAWAERKREERDAECERTNSANGDGGGSLLVSSFVRTGDAHSANGDASEPGVSSLVRTPSANAHAPGVSPASPSTQPPSGIPASASASAEAYARASAQADPYTDPYTDTDSVRLRASASAQADPDPDPYTDSAKRSAEACTDTDTVSDNGTPYSQRSTVSVPSGHDNGDAHERGCGGGAAAPHAGVCVAHAERTNELTNSPDADDAEFVSSFADDADPDDADDDFPTLGAEAYHGIAGEIVQAVAPETEADPAGVLVTLLAHLGASLGRGPHVVVGTTWHRANLYACLVGDTSAGKGIAESMVEYVMQKADPSHAGTLGRGLSTGEGLIDCVADDDPPDDDANAQAAFRFALPQAEKRLLAIEEEIARTMTAMRREGNTLSPILRTAWDGGTLEKIVRHKVRGEQKPAKPLRASNAHISVIGHVTPQELSVLLGKNQGVDLANGFSNRFMWTCVRISKLLPHGGDAATVLDSFAPALARALAQARSIGRVSRDADADRLWEGAYEGLVTDKPGAYGLVVGRGRAHVVRLSLIYAALDGSGTIGVPHLRAALALWRYCDESAMRIFGQGTADADTLPLHVRLLDCIVKTPGITRKGLHGATGNNLKACDLDAALATLTQQRLAHARTVRPDGGGRPAEHWYPGPDDGDGGGKDCGSAFVFVDDAQADVGVGDDPRAHGPDAHAEGINAHPADDGGVNSFLPEADDANAGGEAPAPPNPPPKPNPASPPDDHAPAQAHADAAPTADAPRAADAQGDTPTGDDDDHVIDPDELLRELAAIAAHVHEPPRIPYLDQLVEDALAHAARFA